MTTTDFATAEDVADPKVLPKAPGHRVLLRPLPAVTKIGSIILSDITVDRQERIISVARVLAVGPDAYLDEQKFPSGEPWCEVGDFVLIGKHAGYRFEYDGVKMVTINDDEVINVVPDPLKVKRNV